MQASEPSPNSLRILHLEDDEHDAELVRLRLGKEGLNPQITLVADASGFETALKTTAFDVILSDRALKDYDGFEALQFALKNFPGTPFIFVCGTLEERSGMRALQEGATDFVLKDQLTRLCATVRRAVRERVERKERERLAAIVAGSSEAIIAKDLEGVITSWNVGAERTFGYTAEEARGQSINMLLPPDRLNEEQRIVEMLRGGERIEPFETVRVRKDGRLIDISVAVSPICDAAGEVIGAAKIAHDITDRKRAERRLGAFSQLGRSLSAVASPREAARLIADVADGLFGWDALTLDSYLAEEDLRHAILHIDTFGGKKTEIAPDIARRRLSVSTRRVLALSSELVLKQEPLQMTPGESPFGDESRPSASIMRVAIQYRSQPTGVLCLHSYTLNAYDQTDLATLQTLADYCAGALERIRAEEKIAVLHTQLLNTARRAGMEEVASNVLHNVGNVLNSVNVSANTVIGHLGASKLAGLERAAAMLKTHSANLADFLTNDPQGRQMPEYLETLAQYWAGQQASLIDELENLNKNILHIKNIVSRQQSFTGTSGFTESVFIPDLLEDALSISASDMDRLGIAVSREFTVHFPVVVDKMKLMLILVNLISNARDALLESSEPHRQLKLRIEARKAGWMSISIADNGVGVAPENRTLIFSHGFTTKKTGHGFGLHSSALAATELGGSLSLESEGLGQGARFTLELPLNTSRKPEKAA